MTITKFDRPILANFHHFSLLKKGYFWHTHLRVKYIPLINLRGPPDIFEKKILNILDQFWPLRK